MTVERYSIDSSILIENWQRLYPPDVFPSVWSFMEKLLSERIALVSWEVYEELKKKDDELLTWIGAFEGHFVVTDEEVQALTTEINDAFPTLTDPDRERSLADPFVIAVAEMHGCAVVTYERPRTRLARPVKIPDVCAERGRIRCIDFIEVMRLEGFKL